MLQLVGSSNTVRYALEAFAKVTSPAPAARQKVASGEARSAALCGTLGTPTIDPSPERAKDNRGRPSSVALSGLQI